MAAIKREPMPPGPIADLFDRLDDLHSKAGRPSMREIAIRAGRGEISSSTVHNVFSGAKVPRWNFLELIVRALGGGAERDTFHALWDAAWRAANNLAPSQATTNDQIAPLARATSNRPELPPRANQEALRAVADNWAGAAPRPQNHIWSNEIPSRKPNFTGRAAELMRLRENLSLPLPHVQVISGVGGIGKTELATEYIHRNIDSYEIIWWIRAEHQDRVRDALVKLGQRLELRQATSDSARDRTVRAVLEALQSGPWSSWLLVFDNADNALDLQKYIPASGPQRHVIITARQPSKIDADSVEVSPFTDAESVSFLRRTVPSLAEGTRLAPAENERRINEARRLARTLSHLPIAVEHAAAYLAETSQSVEQYLTQFTENADQLIDEQSADPDLPVQVLGTWTMSNTLLTRDAEHLFNLCSFFSPEPIAAELLLQPADAIEEPSGLAEILSSAQRFRAAAAQLHRLSLARVDGARDVIQVHRVVQAVTQRRLRLHRIEVFDAYRAAAEKLLASSNPGNPDHASSDHVYDLSLQHLESGDRFLHTRNPELRTLIIDQVRRLHLRGGHVEAVKFGEEALQVWRESLGEDDIHVLAMSVEVAIAMHIGGRAADAHRLILDVRPTLQSHTEGDWYRVLLLCENIFGADLRAHGQFREALDLDLSILPKFQGVFGRSNERTLNVSSNIAIDYRELGDFRQALETDQATFRARESTLGSNDVTTLTSANAVARDLRGLGLYQESLDQARRVRNAFDAVGGRENIRWLHACEGFATALRKAGHHWDALQECEHVLQRCRDYLGADHKYTLRAAADLINDRRAVRDVEGAKELAWQTHNLCSQYDAPAVLVNTVLVNLASVLRIDDQPEEALLHDDKARKGFGAIYGDKHPFTLAANVNYASDLAACARLGEAIELGQETFYKCRDSFGPDHPDTLMAAANLASDEMAAGKRASGEERHADALSRYERTLTLEHAEARAAASWVRLTAEIEPYDL